MSLVDVYLEVRCACQSPRVCLAPILLVFLLVGCTSPAPRSPDQVRVTTVPTTISWNMLQQRPVHLPSLKPGTPCPTTHGSFVIPHFDPLLGKGPVYADFFGGKSLAETTEKGILDYVSSFGDGSQWGGQKVLWFINPTYRGPVLIRGGQLDGVHGMRFNGGTEQQSYSSPAAETSLLSELRLIGGGAGEPWPDWGTYTRLQAPGCYAYQVDGTTFSYLIIFKAVLTS
mgnify:CR=1 FL=1